ncbi:NUDIX hydrolase [Serinicoccus marinus]|uniref:NUDIX hydrolase n=1 Tax=Serinicoccus marinus TaxID=247333 RepID=UPI0003B37469|nr:NUDIX hydrolase [Serinicoccus marinus]
MPAPDYPPAAPDGGAPAAPVAPHEEAEPAAIRLRAVADGVVALAGLSGLRGRDPETAVAAVGRLVEEAFAAGRQRVEAEVRTDDADTRRVLQRAGLRPEGVSRGRGSTAEGIPVDLLRLARLADDPAPGEPGAFLGMLDATLPRKRLIAQGLLRDDAGRVLLCELTYKQDWDLPGGVVDPDESPRATLAREIREELGLELPVGDLLAVNWLPRYKQWTDALLLVFDLGVRPGVTDEAVLQRTELRALHWVEPRHLEGRVAPYVARHLASIGSGEAAGLVLEDGIPTQE